MTMREILFRGKHICGNGDWIYGYYFQKPDPCTKDGKPIAHCISDLPPFGSEIVITTLGQFTGLTDKHGTKIFEGDIVHMNSRKFGLSGHGVVVYRNGGFAIDDRKRNRLYPFMQNGQYNSGEYRVDGNIYDNPELMEDK